MPIITLPDGNQKEYSQPITVSKIAFDIGPGLANSAIAGEVIWFLKEIKTMETTYGIGTGVWLERSI